MSLPIGIVVQDAPGERAPGRELDVGRPPDANGAGVLTSRFTGSKGKNLRRPQVKLLVAVSRATGQGVRWRAGFLSGYRLLLADGLGLTDGRGLTDLVSVGGWLDGRFTGVGGAPWDCPILITPKLSAARTATAATPAGTARRVGLVVLTWVRKGRIGPGSWYG
jgi:hypothetical protein